MKSKEMEIPKFTYSQVPDQENILKASFMDEGVERSVLIQTFSDKQFELFDRIKNRSRDQKNKMLGD
jgi:hypothetical protein